MSHFPAPVSEPVHEDWTRVLVEDWEWVFRMRGTEASWRVWLAYKAVRWFGRPAWDEEDDFQLPKQLY